MKNNYFLAAFRGKNGFWRYLVVLIIVFVSTQLATIPYASVVGAKAMMNGVELTTENFTNFELLGINSNLGLFLLLLSFVVGFILILLLIRPFHDRSVKTTLTSRDKFDWNRFFFAILLWGGLMIISFIISYLFNPENVEFQFNPQQFFILIIIAITCISMQASFEEILFRGYLQQGFAVLTKNAWFPLIITSVIFGLLHAMNPEVEEYGFAIMIPQYIILGLFLAIMTIMDEGLELAIGVHVVNNVLSALLVTHESSVFQTAALFRIETIDPVSSLFEIIIVSVLVIGIMAYKYKWGSFKKLYAKVKPE